MTSRASREPFTVVYLGARAADSGAAPPDHPHRVVAFAGDTVLDAALDNGIELPHECGGNCTCTTCHVLVEQCAEYLSPMELPEDERLNDTPLRTPASRLACQALIRESGGELQVPLVVRIVHDQTR